MNLGEIKRIRGVPRPESRPPVAWARKGRLLLAAELVVAVFLFLIYILNVMELNPAPFFPVPGHVPDGPSCGRWYYRLLPF